MKNEHNHTIDSDALHQALQQGTDRTAARSPALWSRILDARGSTRHRSAKPWIALGATALAAAALVVALPRWLSAPDVVRQPAASAQPSATITVLQSTAQQTPLASGGASLLDGRFALAADGDASLGQLYADVLAMVQARDSNAPAAVSQLMEVLLARQTDLSTRLYAMTTGSNGNRMFDVLIGLKGRTSLDGISGPTKEQKALLQELFSSGYTVDFIDGSPYAKILYTGFQQQFSTALDDELRAYLSLQQTEDKQVYQAEGLLYVSTEELVNRYLSAQDYLSNYDEAAQGKAETHPWRTKDIAYLHSGYLSGLFTLNGALFAGEGLTVPQEYRATYDTAIAAIQGSHPAMAATLSEYKALLQAGNWTMTDEIRTFLTQHSVPGYAPAIRLIWAEMSIYGVKLDSDGETALPKLNKAIGAEPATDTTTEDAGGKTRTLTWANGTVAAIRNGKVYSLETTATQAPLVRGLSIGDPKETLIAYLGQPLRRDDVWTWGVGSNDNIFAWFTDNQLEKFKISLTE